MSSALQDFLSALHGHGVENIPLNDLEEYLGPFQKLWDDDKRTNVILRDFSLGLLAILRNLLAHTNSKEAQKARAMMNLRIASLEERLESSV